MLTIRKRYQCQSCHMLWMQEGAAQRCCSPDEVYLCGKRITKSYGLTACVHFDRKEARKCQKTDKRTKAGRNKSYD